MKKEQPKVLSNLSVFISLHKKETNTRADAKYPVMSI